VVLCKVVWVLARTYRYSRQQIHDALATILATPAFKIPERDLVPLVEKIEYVRSELIDEYRQPNDHPWVTGYSGGKNSTVVAHLVLEMLLVPPAGSSSLA
jgi:hypothetical protein